jgi:response regulator RpfG family c-di-GMP phosphodiesterase
LYIKYNIYRKFIFINENNENRNLFDDFYIKKIDRTINVFAKNKIKSLDSLSLKKLIRDNNVIINNSIRKSNEDVKKQKEQLAEKQTLTVYTIDHNRVNDELNQTYDNLYLEYLISIQHRDITPEDYEHLCKNFTNIF